MRWPKGPPHLALNPPRFLFFGGPCFFLCFVCFLIEKKLLFLQKRAFCLLFSVSLCFSLVFFLPFFTFSFSVSLLLFYLFLLFFFLFCFILLPCCFLLVFFSCFFAFVSWKEQHQNTNFRVCLSSILSMFWLSVPLFSQNPFPQLCFFLLLSFVLFNINVFLGPVKIKTHICGQEGGCNITVFYNQCFAKCEVIPFCHFLPKFG